MIFIIVSSFENEEEFGTDPYSYYIELDKLILTRFGDDYHDSGNAKCHAWIQGYAAGKGINDYEIKYEDRADQFLDEYGKPCEDERMAE